MQAVTSHWIGVKGENHPASKATAARRAECVQRAVDDQVPLKALAMDYQVQPTTVAAWLRDAGYVWGWVKRK